MRIGIGSHNQKHTIHAVCFFVSGHRPWRFIFEENLTAVNSIYARIHSG
jgi:hypothetical protein